MTRNAVPDLTTTQSMKTFYKNSGPAVHDSPKPAKVPTQ